MRVDARLGFVPPSPASGAGGPASGKPSNSFAEMLAGSNVVAPATVTKSAVASQPPPEGANRLLQWTVPGKAWPGTLPAPSPVSALAPVRAGAPAPFARLLAPQAPGAGFRNGAPSPEASGWEAEEARPQAQTPPQSTAPPPTLALRRPVSEMTAPAQVFHAPAPDLPAAATSSAGAELPLTSSTIAPSAPATPSPPAERASRFAPPRTVSSLPMRAGGAQDRAPKIAVQPAAASVPAASGPWARGAASSDRLGASAITISAPAPAAPDAVRADLTTVVSPTGARSRAPQRAFALDELGMFGLRTGSTISSVAVMQAPPSGSKPAPETAAVTQATGVAPSPTAAGVAEPGTGRTEAVTAFLSTATAAAASRSRQPTVSPPFVGELAAQAEATDEEPPAETEPSAGSTPARRAPEEAPKSPLSLTLADNNGQVQVVAGAPPLSAEAAARLRRLIEATTAEYGKKLLTVTLNGDAVEAPGSPQGASRWR